MKKLSLTVVPLDLHARPIGSDHRALIRRAVMPSHAVADSQSFGLVGRHEEILPRESPVSSTAKNPVPADDMDIKAAFARVGANEWEPLRERFRDSSLRLTG